MGLQVAWDKCSVQVPGEDDGRVLRRGEYVPEEVSDFTKATLLSIGAARMVDESLAPIAGSDVAVAPLPPPEPINDGTPAPAESATRAEWEDFAVEHRGLSRDQAEGYPNKGELIAAVGG